LNLHIGVKLRIVSKVETLTGVQEAENAG
jgi:hypothetical protein